MCPTRGRRSRRGRRNRRTSADTAIELLAIEPAVIDKRSSSERLGAGFNRDGELPAGAQFLQCGIEAPVLFAIAGSGGHFRLDPLLPAPVEKQAFLGCEARNRSSTLPLLKMPNSSNNSRTSKDSRFGTGT